MNLLDRSFLKQFKTFAVRIFQTFSGCEQRIVNFLENLSVNNNEKLTLRDYKEPLNLQNQKYKVHFNRNVILWPIPNCTCALI